MVEIDIQDLHKSFGEIRALSNVDFRVDSEELCVIVGPSGSGKSTLLKCIAGVEAPDSGAILVGGRDIVDTPIERRNMGLVFQEFDETLFPHKTVGENVAFGLHQEDTEYTQEEIDEKVDEVLSMLAIAHTKDEYPGELSGGQQQRVELARQLVRDCDVVLLDDALSDLDYKMKKEMEPELRRQHEESKSAFIYVTHNQDIALEIADKLVVLNRGRVEQVGTPKEAYKHPENVFVARFLGDSTFVVGTVTGHDDATVTIDSSVGAVSGTAVHEAPDSGEEAYLVVRPEDISITGGMPDADNRLECHVETRTFTGEETEFIASIGDIDFTVTEAGIVGEDEVGADATIAWRSAAAYVFTCDSLSVVDSMTVEEVATGGVADE